MADDHANFYISFLHKSTMELLQTSKNEIIRNLAILLLDVYRKRCYQYLKQILAPLFKLHTYIHTYTYKIITFLPFDYMKILNLASKFFKKRNIMKEVLSMRLRRT